MTVGQNDRCREFIRITIPQNLVLPTKLFDRVPANHADKREQEQAFDLTSAVANKNNLRPTKSFSIRVNSRVSRAFTSASGFKAPQSWSGLTPAATVLKARRAVPSNTPARTAGASCFVPQAAKYFTKDPPQTWGSFPQAWGMNPRPWGTNPQTWGNKPQPWGNGPHVSTPSGDVSKPCKLGWGKRAAKQGARP